VSITLATHSSYFSLIRARTYDKQREISIEALFVAVEPLIPRSESSTAGKRETVKFRIPEEK
jgi:hypothetical protein